MAFKQTETYYILKSNHMDEIEYVEDFRDLALSDRDRFREVNPSFNWELFRVVVTTITSLVEE